MFRTGDRVLVLTSYGELPGRIVAIDGEVYSVRTGFPGLPDTILVSNASLRFPMDAASNERKPGNLATSAPAYDTRPEVGHAKYPEPPKRKRRMDRDTDDNAPA